MVSVFPIWMHSYLQACSRRMGTLAIVSGLILGNCLAAMGESVFAGLVPGLAAIAKSESTNTNSVKAQTDTLYRMASKELRSGNKDRAVALLQQILTLDPQHKKAKEELEKLTQAGSSVTPPVQGQITVDSLSAKEMIEVAESMMRDGDLAGAEEILIKAQKKNPTDQEKKKIGMFLNAIQKDKDKSTQVKSDVMNYNLDQVESHLQKAAIYLENNQYDKAELELQRAKLIAPDDKRIDPMLNQVYQKRTATKNQEVSDQKTATLQENKDKAVTAEQTFREGVVLYKQGQVIEAVGKWNQALQIYPDHVLSQTYLNNTEAEYKQAIEEQKAAQQQAAEEAQFEAKLDQPIMQYSTEGESLDIKNVLSTLSKISGLNIVMGENLAGKVAFEVKNTTVRNVLNLLQKQYGFVWKREKETIFVEQGFETRVFPLTEGQYKTIESILNDPSVLEDTSKNLRTILYGPGDEFSVPGKQLYLNKTSQSLIVTDTKSNLQRVEAFLKDMPVITGEQKPVETRTYKLGKDIAKEVFDIVKLVLYKGQGGYDLKNPKRALYLEPSSNVMIVIDYPENIEEVEKILASQQINQQLEEGKLEAKQFTVTDTDDVENTPEAYSRREEFVNAIAEILSQMLYGKEGRDAAKLQGRMMVPNPDRGTIDVVDTRENIRRVEDYLNSVRGESTQDLLIERFPIEHVDVFTIADALGYVFFDSQQSTRSTFLSQNSFQSIGSSEQGDAVTDAGNLYEETTRNRFNITGGGGSSDLLQFLAIRFYPDPNTNSIVVLTPDQESLDLVTRIVSTFDKPQRMVEVETRAVRVSLTDLRTINFDYVLTDPLVDKISLNPEQMQMDVGMSSDSSDGLSLGVHTFGRSRMDFLMNLLESTTSFQLLNAPKYLSVANPTDPPLVFVGQQIPFAQSANYDDNGDDDPTNNRLVIQYDRTFVGSMLAAIPFILNDDHIYIELNPQIIEPGERLPIEISGEVPEGSEVPNVGPLLLNQQYLRTSVRMKNGSTMVVGGLISERENETKSAVPLLSKIPFLGNLFIDRNIEKEKFSTLYFITARIIEPTM